MIIVGIDAYCVLSQAGEHVALTSLADTWLGMAADVAEKRLRRGKILLDTNFRYPGLPVTSGRHWPRSGVCRFGGLAGELLDDDEIPDELGQANALLAASLEAADREADNTIETLGIVEAGDTTFSGSGGRKVIPDMVRDLMEATGYGRLRVRGAATLAQVRRG